MLRLNLKHLQLSQCTASRPHIDSSSSATMTAGSSHRLSQTSHNVCSGVATDLRRLRAKPSSTTPNPSMPRPAPHFHERHSVASRSISPAPSRPSLHLQPKLLLRAHPSFFWWCGLVDSCFSPSLNPRFQQDLTKCCPCEHSPALCPGNACARRRVLPPPGRSRYGTDSHVPARTIANQLPTGPALLLERPCRQVRGHQGLQGTSFFPRQLIEFAASSTVLNHSERCYPSCDQTNEGQWLIFDATGQLPRVHD